MIKYEYKIHQWSEIENKYMDTLLLGNGSSIAVDKNFLYSNLSQSAHEKGFLAVDLQRLFEFFKTSDFEMVLRLVWQASKVNEALAINDQRTHEAYVRVRESLIQTVRSIHPSPGKVVAHLQHIQCFVKRFKTVLSLNYDLILYWAMLHGRDPDRSYVDRDGHGFADCFLDGSFDTNWQRFRTAYGLRTNSTLVFYPHGNLSMLRNFYSVVRKVSIKDEKKLLEKILESWNDESSIPLFVSEGTAEQKVKAIHSAQYLTTVYTEVLPEPRDSIVLYGWSLSNQDIHLIEKLAKSNVKRIAVSVYENDQDFCHQVNATIKQKFSTEYKYTLEFFDSKSEGCWNNKFNQLP